MLATLAEAIADRQSLYAGFKPTLAVVITYFQSKLLGIEKVVS